MKTRRLFFSLLLSFSAAVSGCAGLDMKNEPVFFQAPSVILKLRTLEPTVLESQGITLRLRMPASGELHAQEHLKVYSRLRGEEGLGLDLNQKIRITYKPVLGKDSYLQRSVTSFDKGAGAITEEVELSPRGEVIRFLEGRHESQAGKFQVLNLSRTPLYPEGPVRIGDTWTHEEKVDVRLESFWVKEKNPAPYELHSENSLTGFAEVLGYRCAVIKSVSTQTKKLTMKVFFKTITAHITTDVEETQYFDYARGLLIAKVSKTRSRSVFQELKIEENGASQSIYHILD